MQLTAKQSRFVKEYCLDFNGTRAAIAAGYSKKTAGVIAMENLKKPNIQGSIQAEIKKTEDDLEITREQLIKDLIEIKDQQKMKTPYAAIRAVEVIAKLMGWLDPRLNVAIQQSKTNESQVSPAVQRVIDEILSGDRFKRDERKGEEGN